MTQKPVKKGVLTDYDGNIFLAATSLDQIVISTEQGNENFQEKLEQEINNLKSRDFKVYWSE